MPWFWCLIEIIFSDKMSISSEAHITVKNMWENAFLSFIQNRETSCKVKRPKPVREKFVTLKKSKPKAKGKISPSSSEKVVSEAPTVQDPSPLKLPTEDSAADQIPIPSSPASGLSDDMNTTEPMTFYPTIEELANFADYVASWSRVG